MIGPEILVNYMRFVYQHEAQNKDCPGVHLHKWMKQVSSQLAAEAIMAMVAFQSGKKYNMIMSWFFHMGYKFKWVTSIKNTVDESSMYL